MYHFPSSVEPIVKTLKHKKKYTSSLPGGEVVLIFSSSTPLKRTYAEEALAVVRYLWPFRTCREKSFTAEFFLCDAPKYLPPSRTVLDENHVNTGYSFPCESLVVFRKQEWFKVFIHECFHYLGLDESVAENINLDMFNIPIQVSLRETYCEVWARLIQCDFLGGLVKERTFAVRNMVRVLRHMGLTYRDLWGSKAAIYTENTNVFAYVILSAILLHDHTSFVKSFPKFKADVTTLLHLVRKNYRSPSFLRRVQKAETQPLLTGPFSMSAIEFNIP
jgi:hypothetical protein